jgi:molybdopterin-guanine dinucleotide biosynthesis protein A
VQAGDLARALARRVAHSCGTAPESHRLRWSAPIGREADVRPYRFPLHTGGVPVAVVVLAGGAARRWGGRDKTAAVLGRRTVLEHAVRGLVAGAGVGLQDVVVVGPPGHPAALPGARWVREDPPGGGPAAGLAAAVAALGPAVDVVVVAAGDAPFAGSAVPPLLAALTDDAEAVIGVDPAGRDQPLLGAYRVAALRRAFARVTEVSGARLRDVLAPLRLVRLPVDARAALDLDTPADLATAERLLPRGR